MKLSKPVNRNDPVRSLEHWYKELSEDREGMATLQYELLYALLGLRSQASRDGWMNWGEESEDMVDFLKVHLPKGRDAERIRLDLEAVRESGETGADHGRFAYEELDTLSRDLLAWCEERREWIALPEGYQFWSDVPATP